MSRPVLATAALCLLALVYGAGLDRSPVYLVHDEVVYAINAKAISDTLHDINGQLLPISIHVSGGFFATPVNVCSCRL